LGQLGEQEKQEKPHNNVGLFSDFHALGNFIFRQNKSN
jgi:hypothetical protein